MIYSCGSPNLLVIPNNRSFDHSSEMLASARMLELLRVIETELPHHIVIFDMPPLISDDALAFAPRVDGVLLVVAEGQTERAPGESEGAARGDEPLRRRVEPLGGAGRRTVILLDGC